MTGSGRSYALILAVPIEKRGSVKITLDKNSIRSGVARTGQIGPIADESVQVPIDTRVVCEIYPTVRIMRTDRSSMSQSELEVVKRKSISLTATWSEQVSGFLPSDIVQTWFDTAGNRGSITNWPQTDTTGPRVTWQTPSITSANLISVQGGWDVAVENFIESDITVSSGTVSNFNYSETTRIFSFDITPATPSGTVTATIAPDMVTPANNLNSATISYDTAADTASITSTTIDETTADRSIGNSWGFRLNLPLGSSGEVDLRIPQRSVTGTAEYANSGPIEDYTYSLIYDTTSIPTLSPLVDILTPVDDVYTETKFDLEFVFSRPVLGLTNSDIQLSTGLTLGTITPVFDSEVEVQDIIFPRDTAVSCGCCAGCGATSYPVSRSIGYLRWKAELTLPVVTTNTTATITVKANSVIDQYANEGPAADYSESFVFNNSNQGSVDAPAGTVLICSTVFTIAVHNWLNSVSDTTPAGGAFLGVSDLALVGNYVYGVVQIVKRHPMDATRLSETEQAGAAVFRVSLTTSACELIKSYRFVTEAARSIAEFKDEAYWFEGSGYLYEFGRGHDGEGSSGNIFKHSSGTPENVGYWRSKPGKLEQRLLSDDTIATSFNQNYGRHAGTMSPMIEAEDTLNMISGYGNLRDLTTTDVNLTESRNEVQDGENWVWVRFKDDLEFRLPILETNDKTAWQILSDVAKITNTIISYENDIFVMKSRALNTAELSSSLSSTATSLTYENEIRPLEREGYLLIDNELIKYSY